MRHPIAAITVLLALSAGIQSAHSFPPSDAEHRLPYHRDPAVLSKGKLPARTTFMAYGDKSSAATLMLPLAANMRKLSFSTSSMPVYIGSLELFNAVNFRASPSFDTIPV